MGLFDKWFNTPNTDEDSNQIPWLGLSTTEQLNDLIQNSFQKPQIIFKHSTRCGISRMVKSQFEKDYNVETEEADLYYLDLLNYREVSHAVANKLEIVHESPQLIVVKDGKVFIGESHGAINELDLKGMISS